MDDSSKLVPVTTPAPVQSFGRGMGTGAGRQKGTLNKDKTLLIPLLQEEVEKRTGVKNFDAVVELAVMAMSKSTDIKIRMQCLSDVAQYTHPKRKAIEMSGNLTFAHEEWLTTIQDKLENKND
jgi:hypothetical protein